MAGGEEDVAEAVAGGEAEDLQVAEATALAMAEAGVAATVIRPHYPFKHLSFTQTVTHMHQSMLLLLQRLASMMMFWTCCTVAQQG